MRTENEFMDLIRDSENITIHPALKEAFRIAEFSNENLFVHGGGGSGKSLFVKCLEKYSSKKIVIVAPTGVAAVNIGGQTAHSFFRFPIGILDGKQSPSQRLMDLWESFQILVIDEISMVRADMFNAIDKTMRRAGDKKKPFGGKQVIILGDIYQLSPIVGGSERTAFFEMYKSKWFFNSDLIETFHKVEFTEIFRQSDSTFIEVLNNCRTASISVKDLRLLNSRYNQKISENAVVITTTNAKADAINMTKLAQIKSKKYTFEGYVSGNFPENQMLAPKILELKVGAKVMVLRNLPKLGLVNGSIVYVREVREDECVMVAADMKSESFIMLEPCKWEQYSYEYYDGQLQKEVSGSYMQIPLKVAFSITIHKSQSATFDEATIDFDGGVFATGQAYVALSRVKSLEGLYLKQLIKSSDFKVDPEVHKYAQGRN